MTDQIAKDILSELQAIRLLLAARPQAPASAPRPAQAQTTGSDQPQEIPQPTSLMDSPGDVQVHFGKNNGIPLSQLTDRSLAFYASVKAPRLDSSGKPFPPRPQDVKLENAARQLHHSKLGTLVGVPAQVNTTTVMNPPTAKKADTLNLDEDVPF